MDESAAGPHVRLQNLKADAVEVARPSRIRARPNVHAIGLYQQAQAVFRVSDLKQDKARRIVANPRPDSLRPIRLDGAVFRPLLAVPDFRKPSPL